MQLDATDRAILSDAALLHDIGYHINYEKHHKHSFHLISHADLLGMTPSEQIAIAHVARYHRGATPRRTHRAFSQLDKQLRTRITKLSAILRVADGLDRGHVGAVDHARVKFTSDVLRLNVVPVPDATSTRLECWGASRKRGLLEEILERPVEIIAPDGSLVVTTDDDGDAE